MSVANGNSEPGTESKNAGENVISDEEKVCLDSDNEESVRRMSKSVVNTRSSENKSKSFSGTGIEELDKTVSYETTDNNKHSEQSKTDTQFLNSTEPLTEDEDVMHSTQSLQVKPRQSGSRSKRSILFTLVHSPEDDDSVETTSTAESSISSSCVLICKRKGQTLAGEQVCLTCAEDEISVLSYFGRQVITVSLLPVLEQLSIFELVLPFPDFNWDKLIVEPEEKLKKFRGQGDELLFTPYHDYESNPSWKLQLDRHILQNILYNTSDKVFFEGWYPALAKYLEDLEFLDNETKKIIVQNHERRLLLSTLNKKYKEVLDESVKLNLPEKRSTNTEGEDLYDLQITFAARERYAATWEQTRCAQNTMKIALQEQNLTDTLRNLLTFKDREMRIHGEIEMFLTYEIQNLDQLTALWTDRYNREVEELDTELVQLTSQKETTENTMKTMMTTFSERVEVIKEITEYFDNLEREAQLKFLRNKGAITIQKWWKRYLRIKKKFKLMAKKGKKK